MFEGPDPDQQRRDAQWQEVSRLFKTAMWLSVCLALAADAIHRLPMVKQLIDGERADDARAWVYVALMYLVSVPLLFLRMRRALSGFKPPNNGLSTRAFVATGGALICIGLILLPLIALEWGPSAAPRGQSLYQLLSGNVLGTALVGGVLGYGAALAAWMLFCGVPKVVLRSR